MWSHGPVAVARSLDSRFAMRCSIEVLRAVAVVLTVFAVLSAATGIDQAYGEYATIGSLFGQDTYREADLTGMAKRSDLISVTQWKQEKADGSVSNIPAHGEVRKVNIPATASHFEARKALVYLPPAALATAKHKPALPVILMMSGQPGSPGRVFAAGGIQTMMDDYAQHHGGLAPIVIAADQLGDDSHNTLCVDSPVYGNALTYLTKDVVDWVKANLPAAQQAQDWAIAGFSQGATCSLQIGANHPDLFGTIIPTGSELKPTNGSESSMISRFFHGDRTAYEKQIPINAIRNHAPSNQTLVIGAGSVIASPCAMSNASHRLLNRRACMLRQSNRLTMRMTGMPCKTRCGTDLPYSATTRD